MYSVRNFKINISDYINERIRTFQRKYIKKGLALYFQLPFY